MTEGEILRHVEGNDLSENGNKITRAERDRIRGSSAPPDAEIEAASINRRRDPSIAKFMQC